MGSGNECKIEGEGDFLAGISWPPRSYTCSFCKREFRSAQALGGHMNVHRKDRARLRQYSPPKDNLQNYNNSQFSLLVNPNLDPNPNLSLSSPKPGFLSSSLMRKLPPFNSKLPALVSPTSTTLSPPFSPASVAEMKKQGKQVLASVNHSSQVTEDLMKMGTATKFFGVDSLVCERRCEMKKEFVNLDLEIGRISPSSEDLDLELRLGYS